VSRRRFQKGCFIIDESGCMYCKHYVDGPDGSTIQVKQFIANLKQMSKRDGRREFTRIMVEVNAKRGSIAPPILVGETFASATTKWFNAVAPNLSPSTVRPRESFLKNYIMPRFANKILSEIGVAELQQFVTDARKSVSTKTVVHMLATIFAVTKYAEKCGTKIHKVSFNDLQIGSIERATPVPFFTRQQAADVIAAAKEPFKTIFTIAWYTGMRAGELLALTVADLDFQKKEIRVNKSSDDRTREIRLPKTKCSVAQLPMPSALEPVLREYILRWTPNERGLLFATKDGLRPRSRDNVVKNGLKPILRKLGLPVQDCGLHAFRHGLATELTDASVPLTVLQNQLRHADIKTTLRLYAHAIPKSQRDAIEMISLNPISTLNSTVLKFSRK
jgi:integrase